MLQRFVAGSAVASVGIAIAAILLYGLAHTVRMPNPYVLALVWCVIPAVWGVWAMLTPKTWMPSLLPVWGAILGFLACFMSAFVLDVPLRMTGVHTPIGWRALGMLIMAAVYYGLWMVVRVVYARLTATVKETTFKAAA